MRIFSLVLSVWVTLCCLPMAALSLAVGSVEPNPSLSFQPFALIGGGSVPVNLILQTYSSPIGPQADPAQDIFSLNHTGTYSFSKIWNSSQLDFENLMELQLGGSTGVRFQGLTGVLIQRNYPALTNPFSLQAYDPDAPIGVEMNQPMINQWSLTLINGVPFVVEGVQIAYGSSSSLFPGDMVAPANLAQ